jgi:hypothetical protein
LICGIVNRFDDHIGDFFTFEPGGADSGFIQKPIH